MNTQQPSPLVPQGVPLDPKNRGRARVKIAVLFVLAVHGIGLMALLMQGCRKEEAPPAQFETDTNTVVAPTMEDTNIAPPVDTNYVAPTVTSNASTDITPALTDANMAPPVPTPPVQDTAEYKVLKGDSFYTIAKKFGVTSKAIADANPTVNPNKLQIGQALVIPAPSAAAVASPGVSAPAAIGNGTVYEVKSGDNLTKIAAKFKVSVKAIRTANNLTTDRITVGQKLKIPAGSGQ